MPDEKISSQTVRSDFNDPIAVVHYARAAHFLGLWRSERLLIERYFPDRDLALLEAGCGAGRVTLGLWEMGFQRITAFDFADELLDQAKSLASDKGATCIRFLNADATALSASLGSAERYEGALFMFNGLMQIPGRANRRMAMSGIAAHCRVGARFLFTTHDRNSSEEERAEWAQEAARWARGEQDPRLVEFGDRYFEDPTGRTFMHLPDRQEILEDLAACGWVYEYDAMRSQIARESSEVREFSDECRFWVARRAVAAAGS